MLIVRNLSAGYDRRAILNGVSFSADAGSVTAILGSGGAGKTTLADALSGLVPVISGQVSLDGEDITRIPLRERSRRGMSYVPSGLRLFPQLSIAENLQIATPQSAAGAMALDFALKFFPEVTERLGSPAGALPCRLQRLTMFVRGVVSARKLLVLDQPGFGLAGDDVQRLFRAIGRVSLEFGTAVLLLEQQPFQALKVAERAWLLDNGRIAGEWSALELLANRAMHDDFLRGKWRPVLRQEEPCLQN